MADKQHRMLVFFQFRDCLDDDVVAVCADDTSCPVFSLLDACKTHYNKYRHIPNRSRAVSVVSVATLKDKNATNSMITLTEYVCKNCKNRVR